MSAIAKIADLERVRYYARQLMTVDDMNAEQAYFLERLRRHNRIYHGWGIVCGLQVVPAATTDKPWNVCVCPGEACCPSGDEVHVGAGVAFDLARPPSTEDDECVPCPCPPGPPIGGEPVGESLRYLAIRYVCRAARPVRTGHVDCHCAQSGCEASRLRDSFELSLLTELPDTYTTPQGLTDWLEAMKGALAKERRLLGLPARPCDPSPQSNWVILKTVRGDLSKPPTGVAGESLDVKLGHALKDDQRRWLPRVQDLAMIVGS